MSITENAVVKIVIDDREARQQLAAFERAKQQALAMPAGGGGHPGGVTGQVGSQALGRSAAQVGATAAATRSGALTPGGVSGLGVLPVLSHSGTAAPGGGRQYAGGAQSAERAGEQIVQREVEGLRRGMARGAQQAATQAATGAPGGAGGRPLFGGLLAGTAPLLSLGAFSFSAMAIAGAGMSALGGASDAYREARGVTPLERSLEERRLSANRAIGSRVEPIRAGWEDITTRALEVAAYGAATQPPGAPAPAPPPPPVSATGLLTGMLGDSAKPVTDALEEAGRRINGVLDSIAPPGSDRRRDFDIAMGGSMMPGGLPWQAGGMPTTAPSPVPAVAPARTPEQEFAYQQRQTGLMLARRDLDQRWGDVAAAETAFAGGQERERNQLVRDTFRRMEDQNTRFGRAERDIGVQMGRARRDIGVSLGDAYTDLATSQGQGREDIERGYQRSVRGAVLSEVLPGGLTGALIGASIQRQDALADLETGGSRQTAAIGLRGDRAYRDLGTRGGDMLSDLATQRADAEADTRTGYERALADLQASQKVASDAFVAQIGSLTKGLIDAEAALRLLTAQENAAAGDTAKRIEAEKARQQSLTVASESVQAVARWTVQSQER